MTNLAPPVPDGLNNGPAKVVVVYRQNWSSLFTALKSGQGVRFTRADHFFRDMARARIDGSLERTFRSYLAPDLLILDDLGLHALTQQQSVDFYELVIARHRSASFVITSNRAVEEWLPLFADPVLGNSALDRLANASYQIVIDGKSYRERLSPHRALLERYADHGAADQSIAEQEGAA